MRKIKKLRNILLATTFGLSFGFNSTKAQTIKEGVFTYGTYEIEGKTYNVKYERATNDGRVFTRYGTNDNKNNLLDYSEIYWIKQENKTTPSQSYKNPNLSKTTQKEWEDAYDKNSNKQNKITPGRNIDYHPPSNTNKNEDLEDLGKTILVGGAIIGGIYLLNELFKPRKPKHVYTEPPKVNPSINDKPLISKNSSGPWWEDNAKKTDENKNWWEEKTTSKELSDLVEKEWNEEVKKADEFFQEIGMNPGAQVKYKVLGTSEIVDGKLIKKDSYSPAREITDEEKVILYYSYKAMKKDPITGSVMEGVELMNKPEKVDEFFKEKGMNPGAQVKYKVLGTSEIVDGKLIKKDSYSPARE
ncbi:MAG: hypothetical protein Q8O84_04385, partial [Nanoarchaeota archaeon]|nr:hypothetical protein [Nanoarchaeota archaeon]